MTKFTDILSDTKDAANNIQETCNYRNVLMRISLCLTRWNLGQMTHLVKIKDKLINNLRQLSR
ncbi:MAG: hypothetical protein IAC69_03695 [Proteobacteria bacterium]|uniref:Uncharacterized protein n=1 Tax=Candidatus Enterousia avistercoris TaxID=2840788 RepID=A0A9D9DFN8_9PROT|nr:hypothetical protein [Candidatus Enterousia avistercoris]